MVNQFNVGALGCKMVSRADNSSIGAIFPPTNTAIMIGSQVMSIAEGALIRAIFILMGVGALLLTNITFMVVCGMELIAEGTLIRAFFPSMGVGALLPTKITHVQGSWVNPTTAS